MALWTMNEGSRQEMAQTLDPGRTAPISPAVPSLLGCRPLQTLVGPLLLCCHFLWLLMDSGQRLGGFAKQRSPTVTLSSEGHWSQLQRNSAPML